MNKERISGIYKWINKINLKYYVGSGKDLTGCHNSRKNRHIYMLNKNKHFNKHFQRAWNKYGEENFEFIIIERDVLENQLLIIEQKYLDIAKLEKNKCYNQTFIAGRIEMTPEIRKKISIKVAGNKHPLFGKSPSVETRKKMRVSRTGKTIGKDHYAFGKRPSEETIKKIKLATKGTRIGKNNPRFNNQIYQIKNTKTGETFVGTQYDFSCTHSDMSRSSLSLLINQKRKIIKNQWILIL